MCYIQYKLDIKLLCLISNTNLYVREGLINDSFIYIFVCIGNPIVILTLLISYNITHLITSILLIHTIVMLNYYYFVYSNLI